MIKILVICVALGLNALPFKNIDRPTTTAEMAEYCNMTESEFVLISSVVEAESDRSTDGDLSGRVLIAETILNRVADSRFPDTITGVLTQSGQFSTVRGGQSVTNRTDYSDEAVMIAVQEIEQGIAPEVMFFNCRNFFSGYPQYDYVQGNYFSLAQGGIQYDE